MKKRLIALTIVLIALSFNVLASGKKESTQEPVNEQGKRIEILSYVDGTKLLDKKTVFRYNLLNQLVERQTYTREVGKGWNQHTKVVFRYNQSDSLEQIEHLQWNNKTEQWKRYMLMEAAGTNPQDEKLYSVIKK